MKIELADILHGHPYMMLGERWHRLRDGVGVGVHLKSLHVWGCALLLSISFWVLGLI